MVQQQRHVAVDFATAKRKCAVPMEILLGNHVNYIWKIKKIVGARFKYFFIYLMTLKYLRDYGRLAE